MHVFLTVVACIWPPNLGNFSRFLPAPWLALLTRPVLPFPSLDGLSLTSSGVVFSGMTGLPAGLTMKLVSVTVTSGVCEHNALDLPPLHGHHGCFHDLEDSSGGSFCQEAPQGHSREPIWSGASVLSWCSRYRIGGAIGGLAPVQKPVMR